MAWSIWNGFNGGNGSSERVSLRPQITEYKEKDHGYGTV
jgi:hypothetical protein